MSNLEPRRWYASKAAAERDHNPRSAPSHRDQTGPSAELANGPTRRRWTLYLWGHTGSNEIRTYLPIDVTGRSLRHVDRLARDWMGHGVAPTRSGGRGVCLPCDVIMWSEVVQRYDCAERRAARVVSR